MLSVGIGLIRLRDTRAEAEKFFEERLSTSKGSTASSDQEACLMLLQVKTHVLPLKVKRDGSKSVLFDSCTIFFKYGFVFVKFKSVDFGVFYL
ncbi:hypothetical protein REPUB_Repub06bG0027900 [Reevesia pubescens]